MALLLAPAAVSAVCFYPGTETSGYQVPLEAEVLSSGAIVLGTVTRVRELHDDASDAEDVSGLVYTVRVSRRLSGHAPKLITLRVANDSGAYRMDVGERHVLLLSQVGGRFRVKACGNSSRLPEGQSVVEATAGILSGLR
jgi:hypothetical protein